MTSTSLAQTVRWFPLRTGLFDLSAELVVRMGQGERPAGQTYDELRLIAPDSTFYLFSFLVISSNKLFLFSAFYILLRLAQRWSGSRGFKLQTTKLDDAGSSNNFCPHSISVRKTYYKLHERESFSLYVQDCEL